MYKIVQPEVIVGLGNKTEFGEDAPPFKTVKKLHINLEDWLGDDLMECHPCYIITDNLKKGLESTDFSGFTFDRLELDRDEYFPDNYRLKKPLPLFHWLKITGKMNVDDVYIGEGKSLFCSDKFIKYLKENFTVNYLTIDPQKNEFDDLLAQMIADSKKSK